MHVRTYSQLRLMGSRADAIAGQLRVEGSDCGRATGKSIPGKLGPRRSRRSRAVPRAYGPVRTAPLRSSRCRQSYFRGSIGSGAQKPDSTAETSVAAIVRLARSMAASRSLT